MRLTGTERSNCATDGVVLKTVLRADIGRSHLVGLGVIPEAPPAMFGSLRRLHRPHASARLSGAVSHGRRVAVHAPSVNSAPDGADQPVVHKPRRSGGPLDPELRRAVRAWECITVKRSAIFR